MFLRTASRRRFDATLTADAGTPNEDRGHAWPRHRRRRRARPAGRRRPGLRAPELLARRRTMTCAAARPRCACRRASGPARDRAAVRPPGPEAAPDGGDRAAAVGRRRVLRDAGRRSAPTACVVDFDKFTGAGHRALADRDRRRRAALRGRARRRAATSSPAPSPPARCPPRKGINVTYARPELPAITEKDVADLGARRRAGRGLHRAVVRALGRGHRAAALARARARLARAKLIAEDREDRGLRGAGRDHRRRPTG